MEMNMNKNKFFYYFLIINKKMSRSDYKNIYEGYLDNTGYKGGYNNRNIRERYGGCGSEPMPYEMNEGYNTTTSDITENITFISKLYNANEMLMVITKSTDNSYNEDMYIKIIRHVTGTKNYRIKLTMSKSYANTIKARNIDHIFEGTNTKIVLDNLETEYEIPYNIIMSYVGFSVGKGYFRPSLLSNSGIFVNLDLSTNLISALRSTCSTPSTTETIKIYISRYPIRNGIYNPDLLLFSDGESVSIDTDTLPIKKETVGNFDRYYLEFNRCSTKAQSAQPAPVKPAQPAQPAQPAPTTTTAKPLKNLGDLCNSKNECLLRCCGKTKPYIWSKCNTNEPNKCISPFSLNNCGCGN